MAGVIGLLSNIYNRVLNGAQSPGAVYPHAGPKTGRELEANGGTVLKSAYPKLALLPEPPAGLNFVNAGQASGVQAFVQKCVTGGKPGTSSCVMVAIYNGATSPRKWTSAGWSTINLGAYANTYTHDALCVDGVWYLAGDYGVLRSTDNLATFTRVLAPGGTYYQACALCYNSVTGAVSCMEVYAFPYYGQYWQPQATYPVYFRSAADGINWSTNVNMTSGAVAMNGGYGAFYNRLLPAKLSMHFVDGYYSFFFAYDQYDNNEGAYYSYFSGVASTATPTVASSWQALNMPGPLVGAFVYSGVIQYLGGEQNGYKVRRRAFYPKTNSLSAWERITWTGVLQTTSCINYNNFAVIGDVLIVAGPGYSSSMVREMLTDTTPTTTSVTGMPIVANAFSSNTYAIGAGPNGFVQLGHSSTNPNTAYDDYATNYAPFAVLPTIAPLGTGAKYYVRAN